MAGKDATPGLSSIASTAFLFIFLTAVFVLVSAWKEGASLVQGFIVTAMLILLLSASGVISKDLGAGISSLNMLAQKNQLNKST